MPIASISTRPGARRSYNKMFCAYLNCFDRLGLTAVPMKADPGPIGGDMSHEFIILAETGESEVFLDKAILDLPAPGLELDFDGDLEPMVSRYTDYYAATDEKHDAAAFGALPDRPPGCSPRASRSGISSISAPSIPEPMGAMVQDGDGQQVGSPWRQLRDRRVAPGRRAHRSLP